MSERIKIGFLLPDLRGGGAERVFITLLRRLDREMFHPELVVGRMQGPYVADVPVDVATTELGNTRARAVLTSLPAWVRSAAPDLVFATSGFAAAAALTRPAWPSATRLVSRLANTLSSFYEDVARAAPGRAGLYRWFNRALYLGADVVICQSDHMLEDASKQIGLGSAKLVRVYNPIDVDHVRARAREQPSAPPTGPGPHLLAVGNLHWRKGYDVLLRAMARVRKRRPTSTLTVFGEGAERPALEQLVAELELQSCVRLAGFCDNPYASLGTFDLLVSSSRYEGFANVIVESLALGTPVVATDCPSANREVLSKGGGRLAPSDDPVGLATQIELALADLPDLRRSVTDARIPERFGVDTIVRRYQTLFSDVVARRHVSTEAS